LSVLLHHRTDHSERALGPGGEEVTMPAQTNSSSAPVAAAAEADRLRIATQLGVPTGIVEMLQDRNILVRFELSDREIRERVWLAHVRWALAEAARSRSAAR